MYSSWSSKKKASKNSANVLSPLFGHIGNCASKNYLYFSGTFGFDKEVKKISGKDQFLLMI